MRRVVITGLATDFWYVTRAGHTDDSVGSTAKSSIEAGFETIILEAAMKGIKPDGVEATLKELADMGGKVIRGDQWEDELQSVLSA